MNFNGFKGKLQPLYKSRDPATRFDQAERIVAKARTFAAALAAEGDDVDTDLVEVVAYLVPLRNTILPQMPTRTTLEACLVEQGWTTLKARELFRSLERLPDNPKSLEEQIVADAETVTRLGLLGLVRQVAMSAAAGQSLAEALEIAFKQLGRRLYTAPAAAEAGALKDQLRDLILAARKQLEESKPQA
jgi:hypothetical protein